MDVGHRKHGDDVTPRTVWLASYPKSGNTWVRAIVTALSAHPHLFQVDRLGGGAQPFWVTGSLPHLGLDSRWLDHHENDLLRAALIRAGNRSDDLDNTIPILRKTHETWRPGLPAREPFPADATLAAVLVVRDPRDVACSFAPFFGTSIDDAIDAMARPGGSDIGRPVDGHTAQPWGTWSTHLRSWLDPQVPFPVHLLRYEDLAGDAVEVLEPVFDAIGLECTREQLAAAIEQAAFERLQADEERTGFREVSPSTEKFFREGRAGGWRDVLTDAQVAAIEADHGDAMTDIGYDLVTPDGPRRALAESRASRRRHSPADWASLPTQLGLDVQVGAVPDELPDASRPRPWMQSTPSAVRIQFEGGNALLVEDGRTVTVQWQTDVDDDADLGWLVQGWSVTIASLQRGQLSLHASTVQIGEHHVALAGHPGAGKSTTAMGLRARGHRLLVDDTTVIEFRDDGAWTTPYARNVHLLHDAADALGVDSKALPLLAGRDDKVAFRPEEPPEVPHRIDRIIVLAPTDETHSVTLEHVRGADRIRVLRQHVTRRGLAPEILGHATFFALLARLADSADVQVLRRPRGDWTLDAVLDAIEDDARSTQPADHDQPLGG